MRCLSESPYGARCLCPAGFAAPAAADHRTLSITGIVPLRVLLTVDSAG